MCIIKYILINRQLIIIIIDNISNIIIIEIMVPIDGIIKV